ncbi:MAG: transporter [Rhodospirillales bacterium]|nr:transporter [Rhodospirillales bacterium]
MLPLIAEPVLEPAPPRAFATAAWCLFDWAITPFPTIVSTFIISNYFAKAIAPDPTTGSAQWSFMIAVAGIVIALLSPPMGAIADRMGHAKRGIGISLTVLVLAAGLLWFAKPDPAYALPVLVVSGAGIVAMELGLLFYNALLPSIAPRERLGRISGWGWAMGYVGGLICLGAALVFLVQPEHPILGISHAEAANIRATGPLAAIWAVAFGWPLFIFVPDARKTGLKTATAVRQGLADVLHTLRDLRSTPQLAWFLIASALYRDGITTILAVGGLYAGGTFGMDFSELIIFGMSLNVTAGLGAATFAWLDDWIGSTRTIMLSIAGLIVFGLGIVIVHDKSWFFGMALSLGVFIGPTQSASRSLAVRLAPEGQVGKVFGLYALTGRAVSFIGPTLFGWVTATTHSQRAGLASILGLLLVGLIALTKVRQPGEV